MVFSCSGVRMLVSVVGLVVVRFCRVVNSCWWLLVMNCC